MNESEENFTINSKSILESLYEKNKQFEWILNRDEIKRKTNSLFGNLMFKVPQIRESVCNFGLKSGVIFINDTDLLFLEKKDVLGGFYITYFSVEEISINDLKSFFQDVDDNSFTYCYPSGEKVKYNLSKPEMVFLKTYIDKSIEEIKRKYIENKKSIEENKLKEEEKGRLQKKKYSILLKELDSDGNGIIDVVEGDDYGKILKLNQEKIIEINRNYIQQFVQISNYLKTKRKSLQSIYEKLVLCVNEGGFRKSLDYGLEKHLPDNILLGVKELKERTDWGLKESKEYIDNILNNGSFNGNSYIQSVEDEQLKEYIEVLKDDSHIFNLLLVKSITMVQSLIKNDMITFYEIYEKLDQLNMFDSKHEKDLKGLLVNVNDGLDNIINEIRKVGENIISSIDDLSFITEESTQLIKEGLDSVNSSIESNNLLTGIQTYQLYKINKQTKGLIG